MKQPKKLLRDQKEILTRKGLNAKEWMLVSDTDDKTIFTIIHKTSKEIKVIDY
jgi:hypothetical protein